MGKQTEDTLFIEMTDIERAAHNAKVRHQRTGYTSCDICHEPRDPGELNLSDDGGETTAACDPCISAVGADVGE